MKTHGWGWLLQTAGMHNCSIVKYDWQYSLFSSAFLYGISGISTLQWLYLIGTIGLKWTDCVSKPILLWNVTLILLYKSFCDHFWLLVMFSSILVFFFFSFKSPKMGITNRMWAASQGRSVQHSPKSKFENWRQNSPITTIWRDWGGTKSP